jgi:hypothetical protein
MLSKEEPTVLLHYVRSRNLIRPTKVLQADFHIPYLTGLMGMKRQAENVSISALGFMSFTTGRLDIRLQGKNNPT